MVMKRILLEFFMGSCFSIIGFFLVAYSWHFLLMLGIELRFGGDKGTILSGLVFGLPIGGLSGILLAEKLVYKTQGWNILGIVLAVLLSIISSVFGIYMMDKIGSYFIFLIPLLVTLTCLFGYNIGLIFR